MKYLISAGHTPSGTLGCGAVDLIDESNCTREVAKLVVNKLKSLGHEVHLLQFDRGNNYNCEDCYVRSNQANFIGGDLFVEIHFNSGINRQGDGCEVLTISNSSIAQNSAKNICNALSNDLGITNRGVKSQRVIVLSHTNMPAILVECLFGDSSDTNKYNADKIAKAIAEGILDKTISSSSSNDNGVDKVKIANDYVIKHKLTKWQVQELIQMAGYDLKPDGVIGNKTTSCIADIQKNAGMNVDYCFGPKTFDVVAKLIHKNKF